MFYGDLRCVSCIFTGAEKTSDLEVLFDPLEEQLDLPSGPIVESGNVRGAGREIIAFTMTQHLARFR